MPRTGELPIQEVLRQLRDGEVPEREDSDSAEEAAPAAALQRPPAIGPAPMVPGRVRRGAIPDFMSDDPEEDLLESMSQPPRRREQPLIAHEADRDLDEPEVAEAPEDSGHETDRGAAEDLAEPAPPNDAVIAATAPTAPAAAPTAEGRPAPRHKILGERDPSPARQGGEIDPGAGSGRAKAAITIAASFGVVMLAAALMARPDMRPSQAAQQPAVAAGRTAEPAPPRQIAQAKPGAEAEAKAAEADSKGFVTASLLNCRSSPAEQAKPVRRLRRGEPVQVLAMEPAWASVSHNGRQCWASSRYISEQEPL